MSRALRMSEHDAEAVSDVAAFCSPEADRRVLSCVWLTDGWAMSSDSYRIDAREVDAAWTGMLNPFDHRPVDGAMPDVWKMVGRGPRREVTGRTLTLDEVPDVRTRRGWFRRVCLGCLAYSEPAKDWQNAEPCACSAPLLDLGFFREAVAHFDSPVRVRWEANNLLRPVRMDEDEHFHLLMPVRRSPSC